MKAPVVDALLDEWRREGIRRFLQGVAVAHRGKAVLGLAIGDCLLLQSPRDELVPVKVNRHGEGNKGTHPQQHGPEDFVIDIEVVVTVTAALGAQDHVIRVCGGILRWRNAKEKGRAPGSS